MHAMNLLSTSMPDLQPHPSENEKSEGKCCVTGAASAQCIPMKYVIKKSFTNRDTLQFPSSGMASIDVARVMADRRSRSKSWFTDGEKFVVLDKPKAREMLTNGVKGAAQWSIYITTSFKKHGAIFAKVNSGEGGTWRFENLDVDASDISKNKQWFSTMQSAYLDHGIGRKTMESLSLHPATAKKIDWKSWLDFEDWAKPKVRSPLYALCVWCLPTQKELNGE